MLEVLYEDNHLIAVNKPAGLLVQGDETGDKCLMDLVKEYLKEKYQKPGNVFLGMLHRLDRPVSGIVLFAKTSKGASRLSEQFRSHAVKKVYQALVQGTLAKSEGTLINYLKKDKTNNLVTVKPADFVPEKGSDWQYAELDYRFLKKIGDNSLIEINLKTGRSHQIRSQLSFLGHPIIGDKKYGSKLKYESGAIALSAVELKFETTTTKEEIILKITALFNQ